MVALVAGKVSHLPASQPGFRLYGWQNGLVSEVELQESESSESSESSERTSPNPMSERTI
jgi:hypothetical protein